MIGVIFIDPWVGFIIGVFSMIAAWVLAGSKRRNRALWLMLAILFGPLTVLLLACFPKVGELSNAATEASSPLLYRKCPFCAEEIRREAVKCKHCGSDVEALPAVHLNQPLTGRELSDNKFVLVSLVIAVCGVMYGLIRLYRTF